MTQKRAILWRTVDGRLLAPAEMSMSHLHHAVGMLRMQARDRRVEAATRLGECLGAVPEEQLDEATLAETERQMRRLYPGFEDSMSDDEFLRLTVPAFGAMVRELEERLREVELASI